MLKSSLLNSPVTPLSSAKAETVPLEVMQGKTHHLRGEIRQAIQCYKQSILNHPYSSLSYFYLGEGFLALKKLPAALKAYCMGLKLNIDCQEIEFYPPPQKSSNVLDSQNSSRLNYLLKDRCHQVISLGFDEIQRSLEEDSRVALFGTLQNLQELEDTVADVLEELPQEQEKLENLKSELQDKLNDSIASVSRIHRLSLELEQEMVYGVNDAIQDKTIVPKLLQVAQAKRRLDKTYAELFNRAEYFTRNREGYNSDLVDKIQKTVTSVLKPSEFHSDLVRKTSSSSPLHGAASFRTSITMRMRRGQLQGLPSATILRKDLGYQFAHQLGCQIPLNSDKVVSLSEIIPQENIVIKPLSAANSEGVYLVKPGYEVTDLNRGEILKNWENLQERLSQDLEQGTVDKDQWIVQELIYEDAEKTKPGRDLKFYCFYGRVALVLEICRFPERQYCWWNRNLDEIETGRYENQRFSGQGVTQEQLKFVESLSDKIPSAFVRIDFLKSWQGLVFCEFAPTFPGGYHNFKDSIDQWLGNCFLDAEGRLMKDLLQGKRFEEFSEIYDRLKGGVSLTSASEREESFKSHKAAIFKNCSKSAF